MPASVHKILIHGEEIVRECSLPVGFFGEDAGESSNKYYRYFRLHHSRKKSRVANMTDLANRSLETSDPFFSSMRLSRISKFRLPPEVLGLLASPSPTHSGEIEPRSLFQEEEVEQV
jgi:hypothetical protein